MPPPAAPPPPAPPPPAPPPVKKKGGRKSKATLQQEAKERQQLLATSFDSSDDDDSSINDDIGAIVLSKKASKTVEAAVTASSGGDGVTVDQKKSNDDNNNDDNDEIAKAALEQLKAVEATLLEKKARKKITDNEDSYVLHWTDPIGNDVNKLWWQIRTNKKKGKKKPVAAFPCRWCHPDEGKVMGLVGLCSNNNDDNDNTKSKKTTTLVKFVGGKFSDAGKLALVPTKELVPMVDPATGKILEEHMTLFFNFLRPQKNFKDCPNNSNDNSNKVGTTSTTASTSRHTNHNTGRLNMMLEKFTLEAIVEKCQQVTKDGGVDKKKKKEKKKGGATNIATTTASATNHASDDDESLPVSPAQRKIDQNDDESDDEDADATANDTEILEEPDEEQNDTTPTSTTVAGRPRRLSIDPDEKEPKQTIRAGCIIEYNEPNAVAGGKDLRKGRISRVSNHKGTDFVLHLETGDMLQRVDRVKLLYCMFRGKSERNDNPKFQAVSAYFLKSCPKPKDGEDEPEWVGMTRVRATTAALQGLSDDLAANPETAFLSDIIRTTGTGSTTTNKASNKKTKGLTKAKKRRATMTPSSVATATSTADDSTAGVDSSATEQSTRKVKQRRKTLGGTKKVAPLSDHKVGTSSGSNSTSNANKRRSKDENVVVIPEKWWSQTNNHQLTRMSKELKSKSTTQDTSMRRVSSRSRQSHHMSAEQLDLAVEVRVCLEALVKESSEKRSVDTILSEVLSRTTTETSETDSDSEDDPLTLSQMQKFLSGDKSKLVKVVDLASIEKELAAWLKNNSSTTDRKDATQSNPTSKKRAKIIGQEKNASESDDNTKRFAKASAEKKPTVSDDKPTNEPQPTNEPPTSTPAIVSTPTSTQDTARSTLASPPHGEDEPDSATAAMSKSIQTTPKPLEQQGQRSASLSY